MNASRVYRSLLRLYPRDHRALFASEMLTVFEESAAANRELGWARFTRFALAELSGLVAGARSAWRAKFTCAVYHSSSYGSGCTPDRVIHPIGESRDCVNASPDEPSYEMIEAHKRMRFLLETALTMRLTRIARRVRTCACCANNTCISRRPDRV